MTELVNTYQPEILLLGATTLGRDLAGAVATTLMTGLTADCTELAVDADGSLAATRPTFGGSLLCTIYTLNLNPPSAATEILNVALPPAVTVALVLQPVEAVLQTDGGLKSCTVTLTLEL